VAFITLGCAKNEVDTNKMRALVHASAFVEVAHPELADIVVVNTCSFITEATEEALGVIFEVLEGRNFTQGTAKLVVAGCLPARYGKTLGTELPEVAAFVSVEDEEHIVDVLEHLLAAKGEKPELSPSPAPLHAPSPAAVSALEPSPTSVPTRIVDKPWAYVKISDGCDRYCSFCTIPSIRGRYKSTPGSEIVAEVAQLVAAGVREIILIGQDTGIWGADAKEPGQNLAQLLDLLATSFPATWLRVMYLQPEGLTTELLEVMAAHDNICHYLDIPLQHASATVLKAMNRRGSGQEYLELLSRIRSMLPAVTLRTTVIAGFPGETRADARELERFIAAAEFDYVGVFIYSQEEGTVAGRRTDQVPLRTRKARAQRLRDLADTIGFARTAQRVGSTCEVLICEQDEDAAAEGDTRALLGRTKGQAPEVDGMVHLTEGVPGQIVSVRMVDAICYELDGEGV
jgi:ribosomal protein S12 methylthiotransferase